MMTMALRVKVDVKWNGNAKVQAGSDTDGVVIMALSLC